MGRRRGTRRYRRNPPTAAVKSSFKSLLKADTWLKAGVVTAGIGVAWMGPQIALRERDEGVVGLVASAGATVIGTAVFAFAAPALAPVFFLGGAAGTFLKGVAAARQLPTPLYLFERKRDAVGGGGSGVSGLGYDDIANDIAGAVASDGVGDYLELGVGDYLEA